MCGAMRARASAKSRSESVNGIESRDRSEVGVPNLRHGRARRCVPPPPCVFRRGAPAPPANRFPSHVRRLRSWSDRLIPDVLRDDAEGLSRARLTVELSTVLGGVGVVYALL